MSDEPRSSRLAESVNEETIAIVQHPLDTDKHITLYELQHNIAMEFSYVQIIETSILHIISNHLHMTKVSACCVSHQLTKLLEQSHGHHHRFFQTVPQR